jgi:hypothetical protein
MALTRIGLNQSINLASNVTGTLPVANGGTALTSGFINGNLVLIKTQTASNVSEVIFDNGTSSVVFDNTYDQYVLRCSNVYGASNGAYPRIRLRSSGTTKTADYRNQGRWTRYDGSTESGGDYNDNGFLFQSIGSVRNTNTEYFHSQTTFSNIGIASRRASSFSQATYKDSSGRQYMDVQSGASDSDGTWNGFTVYMNSGNIYGSFSLYGVNK